MVLSAFFSGMEIAFVSSNRMLAEMDKGRTRFIQKILSSFYAHPNGFVSTMLVGNNIVLVVYGILIANLFDNTIFRSFDAGMKVTADTILSTVIVLFTGEFLPKILFKNNANRLLSLFALPAYLFYVFLIDYDFGIAAFYELLHEFFKGTVVHVHCIYLRPGHHAVANLGV